MGEKHKGHVNLRPASIDEYLIILDELRNRITRSSSGHEYYYKLYIVVRLLGETELTLEGILLLRNTSLKRNDDQYYLEYTYENYNGDPKIIWITKDLWDEINKYTRKFLLFSFYPENSHLIPGRIIETQKNGAPYRYTKAMGTTTIKTKLKNLFNEIDQKAESLKNDDPNAFIEKYKDYQKYSELGPSSFRKLHKMLIG